jgi:hypothetical protein
VADVLQQMIKANFSTVRHPLVDDCPCPVLQYADDTLVLIRGDPEDVQCLKAILDSFALPTGLKINYAKTTVVPIHLDESKADQCISILGCKREAFPQMYLGLPLSMNKLQNAAFTPYIAKADRYLVGWQAALLNAMGRSVLVNSVLDSQLISMCALPLPVGVIAQMDQHRRSFLWSGEGTMTGAQSLVAWERVCWSKDHGGLGIRDLGLFNVCLLLKLLHRLFVAEDSAWAAGPVYTPALPLCMGISVASTGKLSDQSYRYTRRSQQ